MNNKALSSCPFLDHGWQSPNGKCDCFEEQDSDACWGTYYAIQRRDNPEPLTAEQAFSMEILKNEF